MDAREQRLDRVESGVVCRAFELGLDRRTLELRGAREVRAVDGHQHAQLRAPTDVVAWITATSSCSIEYDTDISPSAQIRARPSPVSVRSLAFLVISAW